MKTSIEFHAIAVNMICASDHKPTHGGFHRKPENCKLHLNTDCSWRNLKLNVLHHSKNSETGYKLQPASNESVLEMQAKNESIIRKKFDSSHKLIPVSGDLFMRSTTTS